MEVFEGKFNGVRQETTMGTGRKQAMNEDGRCIVQARQAESHRPTVLCRVIRASHWMRRQCVILGEDYERRKNSASGKPMNNQSINSAG